MATPKIIMAQTLDWIERTIAEGRPAPTDREMVDRYGLSNDQQARAIIADLADAGKITVKWNATGRPITLGRRASKALPTPRPLPSVVVRSEAKPDEIARIRRILKRQAPAARAETPEAAIEVATSPRRKIIDVPPEPSRPRPLITAAMTAAAIRDGMAIADFAAMLLARGFASYEADVELERAA